MDKKRVDQVISLILASLLITVFSGCVSTEKVENRGSAPFYDDRVATMRIVMSAEDWKYTRQNAIKEEYVKADIWYDGELIPDIAVRPKGNSSLMLTVMRGSPRVSLKVDLNFFNSARNLYGVKKLNLNNGFSDPTLIREVLAYELFEQMGLPTPRASFVDLWVNDTHFGLYTMAESIDKTFLSRHFTDNTGNLYKPEMPAAYLNWTEEDYKIQQAESGVTESDDQIDETDANLGGGNLMEIMKALKPREAVNEADIRPSFPFMLGMSPKGNFIELMGLKTNENRPEHSLLFRFLDILNNEPDGTFPDEIEKVLDVDEVLRFLAVSTLIVHLDNYIAMGHNYYLYDNNGKFVILPWDLNMAFGTFNFSLNRDQLINYYIDEPSGGPMAERPLVKRLLAHQPYLDAYHGYLEEMLDGPFDVGRMESRIDELAALIRPYVQADELKLFSIEQFEIGLEKDIMGGSSITMDSPLGLKSFVNDRSESVREQLEGKRKSGPGDGSGNGGRFQFGPPGNMPPQPILSTELESAPYVSGISPEEAGNHIGKSTTACGLVTGTQIIEFVPQRPHILQLDTPRGFAVSIAEADVANFPGDPIDIYRGKTICAKGVIFINPIGEPMLIVRNPSQITVRD